MRSHGRAYVLNGRTKQQMPLDIELLEDMEMNLERFNIIKRVEAAKIPIAIIQGAEDYEWLRKGSAALVQANPSIPWIQIPAGNHTFKAVHPFKGTTEPLEAALNESKKIISEWAAGCTT